MANTITSMFVYLIIISALFVLIVGVEGQGQRLPFSAQHVISTTINRPKSVFAIDLDGDGDVDVLVGIVLDDVVAWYDV